MTLVFHIPAEWIERRYNREFFRLDAVNHYVELDQDGKWIVPTSHSDNFYTNLLFSKGFKIKRVEL